MKKLDCMHCQEKTKHNYIKADPQTGQLQYECQDCENLTLIYDKDRVNNSDDTVVELFSR